MCVHHPQRDQPEVLISTQVTTPPVAAGAYTERLNHLQALEAESLYILREAVAEFARPVMPYSIGKDSSVMLRLAQKAFYPGRIPFPLLHIDTGYKFRRCSHFATPMYRRSGQT